jgi:hypothetical protein
VWFTIHVCRDDPKKKKKKADPKKCSGDESTGSLPVREK